MTNFISSHEILHLIYIYILTVTLPLAHPVLLYIHIYKGNLNTEMIFHLPRTFSRLTKS